MHNRTAVAGICSDAGSGIGQQVSWFTARLNALEPAPA
jgi:hypothetical protein